MWHLAERNNVVHKLPCKTLEEMRAAYNFQDLQSFLNLYYAGCAVLIEQQVCAPLLLLPVPLRAEALYGMNHRPLCCSYIHACHLQAVLTM